MYDAKIPFDQTRDSDKKLILFISIGIKENATPLLRIAAEMQRRGYIVAFATHDSGRNWVEKQYQLRYISAGPFPISTSEFQLKFKQMTQDVSSFRGILMIFNDIYVPAAQSLFASLLPQLNSPQSTFRPDIIVADIHTFGARELAEKLNIPLIFNAGSLLQDSTAMGVSSSVIEDQYLPAWGTGFSIEMTLYERCLNLVFPRLMSVALTPPFMALNKWRYDIQLSPYRSQQEIYKGIRILVNTAIGFDYPQKISPLIEYVGPILPNSALLPSSGGYREKPLHKAVRIWLDNCYAIPNLHVIYINLGSMVYLDPWQVYEIIGGLQLVTANMQSKQQLLEVFWVVPLNQRATIPNDIPSNIKIIPPQDVNSFELLSHGAVSIMISNCGMTATQEALVTGTPIICIPFIMDQADIAARVLDSGAGNVVSKKELSMDNLASAISLMLSNLGTFQLKARYIGKLLVAAGGINRSITVIDAHLRIGIDHLIPFDTIAPWTIVRMLDVYLVYIAIFCLIIVILYLLWVTLSLLAMEMYDYCMTYISTLSSSK